MNTKKITTPIAKVVIEIKEWITGRDYEQMMEILTGKFEFDANGNPIQKKSLDPAETYKSLKEYNDSCLKMIVISVDGQTENLVEKIKDLPNPDYKMILEGVLRIANGENFEKPVSTPDVGID